MTPPLWLIPALPLAGFLACGLAGSKLGKKFTVACGVGSVGLATMIAWWRLIPYIARVFDGQSGAVIEAAGSWIHAGSVSVDLAFRLDPLSGLMIGFVTFVGFWIHVYSIGYIAHEEGFARFFAYMNLFMFSMLTLVLAANFLLMFLGWEGVGLCSYLLIGFYYDREDCVAAGKKAFVVNRIGDVGFILGVFGVFSLFGTLDFGTVFSEAAAHPAVYAPGLTLVCICLFVGAVGKSAQIPLYVWLPDAMLGPTPVSALIHAATMVTAGVYMVARCNVLYRLAPDALLVVALVGGVTAFYAATIGIAQNDIKKVLAYSTISQLGYMFLGCGVGAFVAGMFHVLTHAFFKALLFLGAGSVIHALGGEQDMRKMGGLRRRTPVTYWTMMVATLAISGIPLFAGFFSKDAILAAAFERSKFLWVLGLLGAALTAFYMFRLMDMTFFGPFRGTEDQEHHLHESPRVMTIPLVVLAVLSAIGGFLGLPRVVSAHANLLDRFLAPILLPIAGGEPVEAHLSIGLEWGLILLSVAVAVVGWVVADRFYRADSSWSMPRRLAESMPGLYRAIANKYFVDEAYEAIVIVPLRKVSYGLWKGLDVLVIDGAANAAAFLAELGGGLLRFFQTGNVRNYALAFTLGTAVILLFWFVL
jgi:NADH-quinone oxidoreductase subunit L